MAPSVAAAPTSTSLLSVERYAPALGAVVGGVDLGKLSAPGLKEQLKSLLYEHQVLFFRNQHLGTEQLVDVAQVFGDPNKVKAFFPRDAAQRSIEKVESSPTGYRYGNDQWHADITFSPNPPTATVLHAHELPPLGGDTVWASGTAIYDALPVQLREYLATLESVHSVDHSGWAGYFDQVRDGAVQFRKIRAEHGPVVHPVIRTHPVTGKRIVYVNPEFTNRIKGLPRQQSDALLAFLFAYIQQPEFHARWRWQVNDVAVWDNRATQHYAVADYSWQVRRLSRITVGEQHAF